MGMNADIIVIGPYLTLAAYNVLDYDKSFYQPVELDILVTGTIVVAEGNYESEILADLCQVNLWDLNRHQIKKPLPVTDVRGEMGGQEFQSIVKIINLLLNDSRVMIFFRPNG